ncbi:hypothetical protein LTR27_010157 [Elasticomyces elasticus]|nr:hypothetical protein LTR27_010157 [Elasticomyces elasticus]
MADLNDTSSVSSAGSLDGFEIDLNIADEWDGNVEDLDDLIAIVRGYVDRSDAGAELDYEIQSLCHSLSAHDLPPFARARLNTYLATSNEGMDEARLDIASSCIDQAIAESMDSSQAERNIIQGWKKHIDHMYTLLVPAHDDTPADGNLGYDGAADTINPALGHDGTTDAALSYYERTHPLALCGSRVCRNESCRAPAPTRATAALQPESPIQSQSQSAFDYTAPSETSSSSHAHSRSHSHSHSHSHASEHGAPLSEEDRAAALEEARKRATARIEHLKQEALSKPTMAGKNAMAAAAERVEKKKDTQRFAKAVPKSHRLKIKNSAAQGKTLSFRSKAGAPRATIQDALKAFEHKEADDKAKEDQEQEDMERGMEG